MSHQIPYRIDPPAPPTPRVDSLSLDGMDSLAMDSLKMDSLATDSLALDSLTQIQTIEPQEEPLFLPLFTDLSQTDTLQQGPYRAVAPEELFGYQSVQAEIPFLDAGPVSPIATPAYGLLVLAIITFYCLMLYQHLGDAVLLIGRVTRERASGERLSEDSNGDYSRFLTLCTTLGSLLLGVAAIRLTAPMLHLTPLSQWPQSGAFWGALLITAALGLTTLYQMGVCAFIGRLTYSQHLMEQLFILKRTFFALLTLIATPFFALWLLNPPGEGEGWFGVIIIEFAITLFLYLQESLLLFISKKISILHWILYLCAVEIFPISLLILLAVR